MNKGYIVNETPDRIKSRIDKILADAEGVKFNACFNSARGTLAGGDYAQFGWTAKEDGTTVLTIEARSATAIENIYQKLFAPEAKAEAVAPEKVDTPEAE